MDELASSDNQFLTLVTRIIEANIGNEYFSVEDLSRDAGLSRSALHRKLVKLTGKSASDFITEIRVKKARELLENDVATVSEISYRVGFTDPSYFTKVFKKYYKVLPGDVRKSISTGKYSRGTTVEETIVAKSRVKHFASIRNSLFILLVVTLIAVVTYIFFGYARSQEIAVAVLPLQNFTGDPDNAYIVDGMHDALIGELGRIKSLNVISRTSTQRYRDTDEPLDSISIDLGSKIIVEGSVMEAADSLKLLIRVIDVFPKEHLVMVDEYQDAMQNALNMQKSAAMDIARNIGIRLTDSEEQFLTRSRTVDTTAYRYYLWGMHYLNKGSPEYFEQGIQYLYKAINADPGEPLAFAGLAMGYAIQGHGMVLPEGSFRTAEYAADKAILIDPTQSDAYTARAMINSYQEWDWPRAKNDFEKALTYNPNNATANAHLSFIYLLVNEKEKAFYHMNMAATLEPFEASHQAALAWFNYNTGNYDKAEMFARKALDLQDDVPYANFILGWTYIRKQQCQEAISLHKKLPVYADYYKMLLGITYIECGQREKAMAFLNEMETEADVKFVNPVFRGILAGSLGLNDRAFELLNEACDRKIFPITYLKVYPGIENIKDDPRYTLLMQKLNLPE